MDLRQDVFIANLSWENLLKSVSGEKLTTNEIPKYPLVRRDLALVLDNHIEYSEVREAIETSGARYVQKVGLFDVFANKNLKSAGKKSYAIYIIFQDPSKTLTDKAVDKNIDKIIKSLQKNCNAELR